MAIRPKRRGRASVPFVIAMLGGFLPAPAYSMSRLNDGELTLSVVDGAPCFGVDRYLGPIGLLYSRKYRFRAGETAVSYIQVIRQKAGDGAAWRVAMAQVERWQLDPARCIRYGDAPPPSAEVEAPRALAPGRYTALANVRDARRDDEPRLMVAFCVLDDGGISPLRYSSKVGAHVCEGALVEASRPQSRERFN